MDELSADFIIQNNTPIEFDAEISESEHFDCSFEINVIPDISHLATKQELEDVNTALTDSIVAVSDNLQIEATTRADNDTILQNNINTVSNNLTAEIGNRAAADTILQGNINSLDDKVDSINGALTDSIDAVDNKYDSITGGLDDKIDSVEGALIDSITAVDGKYDTITSNLSDSITTLSDTLEAYNTALNGRIDTLAGAVSDLDSIVSSNYTTLNDKIDSIDGALSDSINALDSIVSDNFTTLSDSITALDSVVSSNFTTLSDSIVALDSVVSSNYTTLDNKIDSVSGTLTDSINALDSVVSSNYTTLDDKIDSISGALSDSISAIDSIISGYGDIVTYNAADFADSAQGALADTALQPNDNISELNNDAGYITSASLPTVNNATITIQKNGTTVESFTLNQATNETVNIAVPTTAAEVNALPDTTTINDLTTSTQQAALNSGANTTNIGQIATNTTAISNEVTDRQNADIALQNQIDAIVSSSDVFDIVGTYAELQVYDISTVPVNDIIKVLVDSTHNDAATYYRCVETGGVKSWSYIGSEGAYYTKGEADAAFVPQTRTVNGYALSNNVSLTALDVGALPDSTVIPSVNNSTITIQKNGSNVDTFTLNQATAKTINIIVPTDTNDLTNGARFISGITSADVIAALGFPPYNGATNPNGYITSAALSGYATESFVTSQGFITSAALADYVSNSSLASTLTNYVTNSALTTTLADYALLTDIPDISTKQDTLVSGSNIKTINNTSILGSGNIDTKEVFVVYYNQTTYQDVESVVAYGKVTYCIDSTETGTFDGLKAQYICALGSNADIVFSGTYNNKLYTYIINSSDVWTKTVTELANTDLSNLSATGEAKFDAKVNKSGDTMTGTLWEQNDFALKRLTNISKGSNPASTIYLGGLRWINADGNNSDDVNRLANIDLAVDSNGDTRLLLQALKNEAGSTDKTAIVVKYPKTGNPSCTFPNTTCVDGQWVITSIDIVTSATGIGANATKEWTISGLPSDSYTYEVLFALDGQTSATSGQYTLLYAGSDILSVDVYRIAAATPRTNAAVNYATSGTMLIGTGRKFKLKQGANSTTQINNCRIYAYRRIGTNA